MNKHFLAISFIIFLSCSAKDGKYGSPKGFDLTNPEKFSMPDALTEISGITFYKGNNDILYAEQDEEGKLFWLHLGDNKADHVKFEKKGDYEDIAILNEQVILLRSDGVLFSFPLSEIHQEEIANTKKWEGLLPEGEFEGLYADDNQLYVLCKHCKDDETTKAINAYMLLMQPDGSFKQNGNGTIDVKTIEKLAGENKFKFHPSAFAKSPKTNQWFILSAVNKMLVLADKDWNVKEVYHLDPAKFRQPEGIAFDKDNNLYISNEGDDLSAGNVLKFAYKKG